MFPLISIRFELFNVLVTSPIISVIITLNNFCFFVQEFEKEYPSIVFIKVDVDKASEIGEEEGISAMPTFKLFKNGQKIDEIVGASEAKVKAALDKASA